ncbi:hypothetical protein GBAR_LOCUS1707, partial [Geodia barretti]
MRRPLLTRGIWEVLIRQQFSTILSSPIIYLEPHDGYSSCSRCNTNSRRCE